MSDATLERVDGGAQVSGVTIVVHRHGPCMHLVRTFWLATVKRAESPQLPLGKQTDKSFEIRKLKADKTTPSVSVVQLDDVDRVPLPTMAPEVYAQPLQVDQATTEKILESSGIEIDDVRRAVKDSSITTDAVEEAYDERQERREDHESNEHTAIPKVAAVPPEPLPRDQEQAIESNLDQQAFVDIGLHEESLQYSGAPWMIHDGFNLQMAAIHLAPHEQLGMEQHEQGAQVIYVLDGNLVVHIREPSRDNLNELSDVFYRCGAGQMVVIPRGVAHNVLNQADDLHVRAWQFYAPRVHPGESGVYATKYRDNEVPDDFKIQVRLTPEARGLNEPTQLFDALLHAVHSQSDNVIHRCSDMLVESRVVRSDAGSVFSREGYYYVVAGRGEVFNYAKQLGSGTVKPSKSKKRRPTPLVPGSVFYVLPNSFAAVVTYEDDTSLHLLAVTNPKAAVREESFDTLIDQVAPDVAPELPIKSADEQERTPYVAPKVFVSEVLNAAPIAAGDIQEVNLRDLIQGAMDARRAVIREPKSDDEEDEDQEEWED